MSQKYSTFGICLLSMKKVVLLGGGNVAYHLARQLMNDPQYRLIQLYNRSLLSADFESINVEKTTQLDALLPADIYILSVKDDAITTLCEQLPFQGQLVVHTSGSVPMQALSPKQRRGVFYPLQSFSKAQAVDFSKVPFCLETEEATDYELLEGLAKVFSPKYYAIDSLQRQYLHVAAVFLNNFTNHLWYLSQQLCDREKIPFELLRPLLEETYRKGQELSFFEGQTGPAKRGDRTVIAKHLALLQGIEKDIYRDISTSILATYGK